MRWLVPGVVLTSVAGCQQVFGLDNPVMATDAATIDASDAPFQAPACSITDPTAVLCLEFEDPGLAMVLDSSASRHRVTAHDITPATRTVLSTSQAVQLGTASVIDVEDGADFDTQAYTLMAWVHRDASPGTSQEYMIIDVHAQYAMRLVTDGKLKCTLYDGVDVWATVNDPPTGLGEWDLVMCSYGNGMYCDGVFPNGVGPGMTTCYGNFMKTLYTSGTGASVGSNLGGGTVSLPFIGSIDSVQVLSKFLTPTQVCTLAGLTGC